MAANYKLVWFFEYFKSATIGASAALGWTEVWYLPSTGSIDTMFTHPDVLKYLELRLALLNPGYRASFLRVSDDANPRLVKIQALIGKIGTLAKDAQQTKESQINCALLVDIQKLPAPATPTDKVHHRRFLIRAIPSTLIEGNILDVNAPQLTNVRQFLDFLASGSTGGAIPIPGGGVIQKRGGLSIRYHDTTVPRVLVDHIERHPTEHRDLLIGPDRVEMAIGSHVKTFDLADPFEIADKTWTLIDKVTLGAPPAIRMRLARRKHELPADVVDNPAGAGFVQLVKWLYGPPDQYTIIGLRNKKTGQVFRRVRGRSSNRP